MGGGAWRRRAGGMKADMGQASAFERVGESTSFRARIKWPWFVACVNPTNECHRDRPIGGSNCSL